METLVAQRAVMQPIQTAEQLEDLAVLLMDQISQQTSEQMRELMDKTVERERKALKGQKALTAKTVLRVPTVQRVRLVLKVRADLVIPADNTAVMAAHTARGLEVTNTVAIMETLTMEVEKVTDTAENITATQTMMAIADMISKGTTGVIAIITPHQDTTVMLDMEVTLTIVDRELDMKTAIKEMLVDMMQNRQESMDTLEDMIKETKEAETPKEVMEAEDMVIVATGAANNSPWKL